MSRLVRLTFTLLALTAMACSPGTQPDSVTAYDTVTSAYKTGADFAGAQTFTVVDSVVHLVDSGSTDEITRIYDDAMVARVRADMGALGWTEIPAPDATHQPDVMLQIGVTTSDYVVVETWPPYWGWYPGWGYPGYGWGWGWTTVYTYSTGTVLIVMLDLRHPNVVDQTFPTIWLGALNGVQSGSTTTTESRIVNGIDQAFEQSPYLNK